MKIKLNESEEVGMNSPINQREALTDFGVFLQTVEDLAYNTSIENGDYFDSFEEFKSVMDEETDAQYNPMVIAWRYYNYLKTIK